MTSTSQHAAESDNGVSVSVGFDMGAGNKIDYNDDDKLGSTRQRPSVTQTLQFPTLVGH